MTPEQTRLDKYYQKTFGWTLAEVDAMFASQGNVCAACGRPSGKNRLSLDHDHAYDRVKVRVRKEDGGGFYELWADSDELNIHIHWTDEPDRAEAYESIRLYLRRKSVRGGLCLRCNKGLQMFEDSKAPLPPAERLENLAAYLRKFKSREPQ